MMKRTTSPVAVVLAVVTAATLSLSGCAQVSGASATSEKSAATQGDGSWSTPRTMPAGKGSNADDGVFPRTVAHFEGSTTIPSAPKKIVVISTGQADALLTLGLTPAASTSGDGADLVPAYLTEAFPAKASQLADVVDVGNRFEPNLEAIGNVDPDLILMNIAGKDAAGLYAGLTAIAPTVATQGTGKYWKQDFLLLADAVGKTQQAEAWLTAYQDDAAAFGRGVDGDPAVSFLRKSADRTRIFGIASFSGSVAEDAGLARPSTQTFTDDTSVDISAEQLSQADGDWLFYGVQGGDETELTGLPLWPTLTAVSAKHAVAVDDDTFFLNVGPTAARAVLQQLKKTLG